MGNLAQAEACPPDRYAEVAREGQLQALAQAIAVDGRHHWLAEGR